MNLKLDIWKHLRYIVGFPCGSAGKESSCNVGDLGSIPGLGRSPGEGKGYPLQDSVLENSTDCIVHGVAESDMTEQLSLHFTCHQKGSFPNPPGNFSVSSNTYYG